MPPYQLICELKRNCCLFVLVTCMSTCLLGEETNCRIYISKEIGATIISRQLRIKSTEDTGNVKLVTFRCQSEEFYLNPDEPLSCNLKGQWNTSLPKCLQFCPKIKQRQLSSDANFQNATNAIVKDTEVRKQNTTVLVTCAVSGYMVSGSQYLKCLPNASWDNNVPFCIKEPPKTISVEEKLSIIFGTIGGVFAILLVVNVIFVSYYRILRKKRVRGKGQSEFINKNNSEKFYKIWSWGRKTRKIIKASNLNELRDNAQSTFSISGSVKILIEGDGTELDTNESLYSCANKTLMILSDKETWCKPKSLLESKEDTTRYTFDVCSVDRNSRKLILANSLLDLIKQGSLYFGYDVQTVCLESDGTLIDEDVKLFAYTKEVLMLLGHVHFWAPNYSAFVTDSDSVIGNSRKMFKVKSVTEEEKVAIVANNVVELHLTAAKTLKLKSPIQICTEEGDIIHSDEDLMKNTGKTLVVSEIQATNSRRLPDSRNSFYTNKTDMWESNTARIFHENDARNQHNFINGSSRLNSHFRHNGSNSHFNSYENAYFESTM